MKAQQTLVHFIGKKIGINNLGLDENLQVTIRFDEDIVLTFLAEDEHALTVVSYVADYEEKQGRMGKQLLSYNFLPPALGGGKLAIDPTQGAIILTHTWDACAMDGESLFAQLEAFVNAVGAVRQDLARVLDDSKDGTSVTANAFTNSLMMYGNMA